MWVKKLYPGTSYAIGFLNLDDHATQSVSIDFKAFTSNQKFAAFDLWADNKSLGQFTDSITAKDVPPHGIAMYRLQPSVANDRL